MNFVKRETLTTEITETGVVERTKKLDLSAQEQALDRIAALPEFSHNRITASEQAPPAEQQSDEFQEQFKFLRQEEERFHSESQAHLKDWRERTWAHQKLMSERERKDAMEFEAGRRKMLQQEQQAEVGSAKANNSIPTVTSADVFASAKRRKVEGEEGGGNSSGVPGRGAPAGDSEGGLLVGSGSSAPSSAGAGGSSVQTGGTSEGNSSRHGTTKATVDSMFTEKEKAKPKKASVLFKKVDTSAGTGSGRNTGSYNLSVISRGGGVSGATVAAPSNVVPKIVADGAKAKKEAMEPRRDDIGVIHDSETAQEKKVAALVADYSDSD